MKKVRLVAVQMKIEQLKPEKNLSRVEYFLKKIGRNNADLVVLSEDNIYGWVDGKKELHQPLSGKIIKAYRKFAQKYNCFIVAGSIIERKENKSYNTSVLIDDRGKIVLVYRKIYLFGDEKKYLTRGNICPVVNTKLGKIGLMICWDLAFPEIGRALFKKGAEIVCCPSFWCQTDNKFYGKKYKKSTEAPFVDSCVVARAYENEYCMVYCGGAGTIEVGGQKYSHVGHTQIAVPNIGVVAKLDNNKEGIITYDLDLQILRDAEEAYEIKKDDNQKIK